MSAKFFEALKKVLHPYDKGRADERARILRIIRQHHDYGINNYGSRALSEVEKKISATEIK